MRLKCHLLLYNTIPAGSCPRHIYARLKEGVYLVKKVSHKVNGS
jgi:hypothetical protein